MQLITIKGTKEGLLFYIEDDCSFHEIIEELKDKIMASKPKENEPIVSVKVKLGHRTFK